MKFTGGVFVGDSIDFFADSLYFDDLLIFVQMGNDTPFIPEGLIDALERRSFGLPLEQEPSPDIASIDDQILELLARVEVRVGELKGQTADQIEEILNGNFVRLQALLAQRIGTVLSDDLQRQKGVLMEHMKPLSWDETVMFGTALSRLQTLVQDEKRLFEELGMQGGTKMRPGSDEAFIAEIFNAYDRVQNAQDLPDVDRFSLSPEGVLRLVQLHVLSVQDVERLVAIQSMFPVPIALSEPEPLNRRVRTLYSLYRAIETGIFDQELFPVFQLLLRDEDGPSTLEEARAAFIALLSPLLSKAAEGKDVCSAHDLWRTMAKLNGMIIRAHDLEQDGLREFERQKLLDPFFAEKAPEVSEEAKIVGKALPLLFRRLSKDAAYDEHERQRLRDIVEEQPTERIRTIFDGLGRDGGGKESVA